MHVCTHTFYIHNLVLFRMWLIMINRLTALLLTDILVVTTKSFIVLKHPDKCWPSSQNICVCLHNLNFHHCHIQQTCAVHDTAWLMAKVVQILQSVYIYCKASEGLNKTKSSSQGRVCGQTSCMFAVQMLALIIKCNTFPQAHFSLSAIFIVSHPYSDKLHNANLH